MNAGQIMFNLEDEPMLIKRLMKKRLAQAEITVGGPNPHDIQVVRGRFYRRMAFFGSLGVGDAYTDEDFICPDIATFLTKWLEYREIQRAKHLERGGKPRYRNKPATLSEAWLRFLSVITDQQDPARSQRVGKHHYDLSPTLMTCMLGPSDAYSCAYFGAGASSLDEGQQHKHRLIPDKLGIKPGDWVLEIGSGRGALAKFLAEECGANVVGVTNSREQWRYGSELCKKLIDEGKVRLELMDYRGIPAVFPKRFDHVVSVGMFEHVGRRHYGEFFDICYRMLKPGGMLLLHTIVGNGGIDPFIWYRVFPGGMLPMEWEILRAMKPYFIFRDGQEFGLDYARTLLGWRENFTSKWDAIKASGPYDMRFFRLWNFYLASCQVMFQVQRIRLVQVVASKGALVAPGYRGIRPRYVSLEPTPLRIAS